MLSFNCVMFFLTFFCCTLESILAAVVAPVTYMSMVWCISSLYTSFNTLVTLISCLNCLELSVKSLLMLSVFEEREITPANVLKSLYIIYKYLRKHSTLKAKVTWLQKLTQIRSNRNSIPGNNYWIVRSNVQVGSRNKLHSWLLNLWLKWYKNLSYNSSK